MSDMLEFSNREEFMCVTVICVTVMCITVM